MRLDKSSVNNTMHYFDHAATTPLCDEAYQAMQPYLREAFGNPSSLHHLGKQARFAVDRAREQVAALLGARPGEIVFNSGATEGSNHVLKGVSAAASRGRHIVTTQIEHEAVLLPCHTLASQGYDVTYLPVGQDGIVRVDDVREALRDDTILVSVMHANNELGSLQPVAEIGAICRQRGILFHSDACQTAGHVPLDVQVLQVDLLTISAHKFYGAKGTGALYIRRGVRIPPLVEGGPHQKGRRAGTEDVAGIVAMGAAADRARQAMADGEETALAGLRDRLITRIESRIDGAYLNGHRTRRVPGIVNFSFDGVEGEGVILELDAHAGFCCSTGSACAAGSLDPSPVLLAINRPVGLARAGTRFSLGRGNSAEDVDELVDTLDAGLKSLRKLSPQARAEELPHSVARNI